MDHTPAPWHIYARSIGTYDLRAQQGPLEVCPATVHGLADAKFIERAVNNHQRMLEALRAARAILADEPQQGGKTWTLRAIRKAIALAEGEA